MAFGPYQPVQFNFPPIQAPKTTPVQDLAAALEEVIKIRERQKAQDRQDMLDAMNMRAAEQRLAAERQQMDIAAAQERRAAEMFPIEKEARRQGLEMSALDLNKRRRDAEAEEFAAAAYSRLQQHKDPARFIGELSSSGNIKNVEQAMVLTDKWGKELAESGKYDKLARLYNSVIPGAEFSPQDFVRYDVEYKDGLLIKRDKSGRGAPEFIVTPAYELKEREIALEHQARMAQANAAMKSALARSAEEKLSPVLRAAMQQSHAQLDQYEALRKEYRHLSTKIALARSDEDLVALAKADPIVASLLSNGLNLKGARDRLKEMKADLDAMRKKAAIRIKRIASEIGGSDAKMWEETMLDGYEYSADDESQARPSTASRPSPNGFSGGGPWAPSSVDSTKPSVMGKRLFPTRGQQAASPSVLRGPLVDKYSGSGSPGYSPPPLSGEEREWLLSMLGAK